MLYLKVVVYSGAERQFLQEFLGAQKLWRYRFICIAFPFLFLYHPEPNQKGKACKMLINGFCSAYSKY